MAKSSTEIRREFIEFFQQRGHRPVPSSSLLPADDPTLLFTNAGMNQFKEVFLGQVKPDYLRAVDSQKCIRAGGKHNDLEDVGHDTYHHTFFEMLGNWSFGDYFKAEAIQWAWQLLTDVWGLPKERLYVTVFEGNEQDGVPPDTEAEELWKQLTDVDPSHIRYSAETFWEMGDVGPCGPNTEIHIDLTEDASGGNLVDAGDPRVMELWNLVFIQYNRDEGGKLHPLPAKHVDTGMGLERICVVLQGKRSNYATDLFVPLIERIEALTPHRYGAASGLKDRFDVIDQKDMGDVACRVIADHARALSFAIADGIIPSNDGRGYVLRRILRRAARYGRQYLKIDRPFLAELVPVVAEIMGQAYPELPERREEIIQTILEEEEAFGRTLDRGIELFQRQAQKLRRAGRTVLPGDVAFDLYATYGFPIDLTQIMAGECGLTVDMDGYDAAMARHRELSGAGEAFKAEALTNLPPTDDSAKYRPEPIEAKVLGWVLESQYTTGGSLKTDDQAAVVLEKTGFYAEAGGQVGDAGHLLWEGGRFAVRDTQKAGNCVLHIGVVEEGVLRPGMTVRCQVDPSRMDTTRNHTATHLLNWALREVLGSGVDQAGSVVAPDRLRFDFTYRQALSEEQLARVERLVNARILADEAVSEKVLPLAEARKIPGVRAVFGEKYPDPVRVICIGQGQASAEMQASAAVEFCGGTHLQRTGQVGLLKILSEESVAKGVRRITAVTGRGAVEWVQQMDSIMKRAAATLRVPPEELPERVAAMQKELKQLRKGPAASAGALAMTVEHTIDSPEGKVLLGRFPTTDAQAIRKECDRQRQKGAGAVLIGAADAKKVTLVAMATDKLVATGKLRADEWIAAVASVVGGGGGGKPTLAQAGGRDPQKLQAALSAAAEWASSRLT